MKHLVFLLIIFKVNMFQSIAQLNPYVLSFDINPFANSEESLANLALLSTKDNLPIKLIIAYGNKIKPRNEYEYNFFYLKPGYLIKLSENELRGKLFYLAANLDMARISHHFKATITDQMQTSRVIEYNAVSYTLGYELELGIYKNVGASLFNYHYGFTIGNTFVHNDPMKAYFHLKRPFNDHVPGIGSGELPLYLTLFFGFGTRL